MKTCIYVFSGTGTSLAVAKRISDDLGDTAITLIPRTLEKVGNNEIKVESSTIGFIFPNYFGGIPDIVLRFIRKLNLDNTDYIFSIVTAGGGQGYCLKFLEEELNKKGKKLNYGKCVVGISNYIVAWYYKIICKLGERRIEILEILDEKASKYAKDIACKKSEVESSSYVSYKLSLLLSPKQIVRDTRPWDKEFSVDKNCIGCGICEKVCQVNNIKMINNMPVFQHNCQRCMACFQYCPKGAIQYKRKSLNKPKYFHPNYPALEIIKFLKKGGPYV